MNLPNRPQSETSALLRETRLQAGLDIEQVSTNTRIPKDQILALEEGRFGDLPGAPYARAFVRTLCQAYGLDPEIGLSTLRRDLGLPGETPARPIEPLRTAAEESSTGPSRAPLLLVGVIGVALVSVIAFTRLQKPPAGPTAQDTLALATPEDFRDPGPPPAAVDTTPAQDTVPVRRTLSLSLVDSSATAFVLYVRGDRVRKRTFVGLDSLELNPDTPSVFRNLSGKPLQTRGAGGPREIAERYFRIDRVADSIRIVAAAEDEWKREYGRILPDTSRRRP